MVPFYLGRPLATIRYDFGSSTVRDQPISPELRRVLLAAGLAAGIDEIVINSGGQDPLGTGPNRIGTTTNHDAGGAADMSFIIGGRTLDFTNPADLAIFENFVSSARANGATGIGAGVDYMGPNRLHVGVTGSATTWGRNGAHANAPDWLNNAYNAEPDAPAAFRTINEINGAAPVGGVERAPLPALGETPVQGPPAPPPRQYASQGLGSNGYRYEDIFTIVRNPSPVERYEARLAEEERRENLQVGIGEAVGMAVQQQWTSSWMMNGSSRYDRDVNWRPTPEDMGTIREGLPEQYHDMFRDARSSDHAQFLREYALEDIRRSEVLGAMGFTGAALSIAAAFLDPTAIAIGIASGGVGAILAKGSQLGRLGTRLMSSAVGAAGEVGYEAIGLSTDNPNSSVSDLLLGGALGAGLGFAFSPKFNNVREEAERMSQSAIRSLQGPTGTGGPVGPPRVADTRFQTDQQLDALSDVRLADEPYSRVRFSLFATLARSPSNLVRHMKGLVDNAVGNKGVVQGMSASQERTLYFNRWMTDWAQSVTPAYDDWAEFKGINAAQKHLDSNRQEFYREAMSYVRNKDPAREFHGSISHIGEKARKLFDEIRQDMNNPFRREGKAGRAAKGWGKIKSNPHHAPRLADGVSLTNAVRTHGETAIFGLVQGAIRKANPEWSDDIVERISKGWVQNHSKRYYNVDDDVVRAYNLGDKQALRRILAEDTNLNKDEVDAIMEIMTRPRPGDAGNDPRAKHRILMDEDFFLDNPVNSVTGVPFDGRLRLDDLFVNDLNHVMVNYARHSAGSVALARYQVRNPEILEDPTVIPATYEMAERDLEGNAEHFNGYDRTETPEGVAVITIHEEKVWLDYVAANPGVHADHTHAFANLQSGTVVLSPKIKNMTDVERAYIIEHEIGHLMVIKKIGANYNIKDELLLVKRLELVDASKLMRPQSWTGGVNDPTYMRYLNSDDELYADTFALWRVDRDRAIKVAPSAAKRFDEVFGYRYLTQIEQEQIKLSTKGRVVIDGFTSDADFDRYINSIRREALDNKFNDKKRRRVEQDIVRLKFAYNQIKGRPDPEDMKNYAQWLNMAQKFNYLRIGGQFGWSAINEATHVLARSGLKAALSQMPAFRRVRNMHGDSILASGLADELEAIGIGADRMTGVLTGKWTNDLHSAELTGNSNVMRKINEGLEIGGRAMADISALRPVTVMMSRGAASSFVQRFSNMANKGSMKKSLVNRMKQLGMDEEMLETVLEQLKKYRTTIDGPIFKRKVQFMNLDKWDNLGARVAMENAIFRHVRRTVQQNDMGHLAKWMSHPALRIFVQFRTHMLGAWESQFLHNIQHFDTQSMAYFSTSLIWSALTYAAWVQVKAIGKDDPEQYRQDNLSIDKMARAGFARTSFSSLAPTMIDTLLGSTGFEPLFDFRSSGQAQDVIMGNPTTGLLRDIPGFLKGVSSVVRGDGLDQAQGAAMSRIFPFLSASPIMQVHNVLLSGLPK